MATQAELFEAFKTDGKALWLVGGATRDRILSRAGNDHDFTTDALPDEVEAIVRAIGAPVNVVGKKFGTVGALIDDKWTEITTFRGDDYEAGTRWPEVRFASSIEDDLARRDFTMNGIAENVLTGERIDLFGGTEDLARGMIRAIGEPTERFAEDPLRILRGLRFASQLGFTIDEATFAGMRESVSLLATLSQERVTAEMDKLLQGSAVGRTMELLVECGALEFVLPELVPAVGCEQNRFHTLDVWGHTVATVSAIDTSTNGRVRRWAALLHDVGKPSVRHVKANGEWGFYRHETSGAETAESLLRRLLMSRRDTLLIVHMVRRHMDRPNVEDRRSVRRFMSRCEGHWRDLIALKRADNASHTYDDSAYHDTLEALCGRIEVEDADALRAESPLTGDDLVRMFEREPGPWIRRVKQKLSTMVLDGKLASGDREGAEKVARREMGQTEY